MNPYKVLGVPKNADTKDIKKAYKKLARKYHPDVNNDKGADERFKEINEAWDILSDAKKRQMYDNFGTTSFKGAPHPERDPFNFRGRQAGGGFGGGWAVAGGSGRRVHGAAGADGGRGVQDRRGEPGAVRRGADRELAHGDLGDHARPAGAGAASRLSPLCWTS